VSTTPVANLPPLSKTPVSTAKNYDRDIQQVENSDRDLEVKTVKGILR